MPPLNVAERPEDWPLLTVDGDPVGVATVSTGLTVTVAALEVIVTGVPALSVT